MDPLSASDVGISLNLSSPRELFESLIAPLSPESFFNDHWESKPLILKGSADAKASYSTLFSLADVQWLVRKQSIHFGRNVNICRYVNGRRKSLNGEGRMMSSMLRKLWEEKKGTIQFHQPQQFKVSKCVPMMSRPFTGSTV